MKSFFEWLHARLDPIALKLLSWMNWLAGILMAGITAFSALHPNFPAEVQAALHLSPAGGFAFGILWCSLVAYVVHRATQANS
jgi:hypothetical protein